MELVKTAAAGTLESSDIFITLEPGGEGIEIALKSPVEKQFGRRIREVIIETLRELGIENARVSAVDQGALDCTIRARVTTAACRAGGQAAEGGFVWKR